jgi:phage shock protein PspC (stress-responsive transcriptional regulator)
MTDANGINTRRLYKSRQNRVIDGVCGGVAEYFDVDSTIVRLLWVLVTLMGGSGFILYIIAMIIMPVNPEHLAAPKPDTPAIKMPSDRKRFFGIMLILIGAFILLLNLGLIAGFGWWSFSRTVILPVLLILLGGFFIYIHTSKREPAPAQSTPPTPEPTMTSGESSGSTEAPPQPERVELRRSKSNRKLFGVCGGVAKYFGLDPTLVRFLFVFLVLVSFGWGLLLYIILGIVMPEEKNIV